MMRTWWMTVAVIGAIGLWAAGCNTPCQTFCDNVTDYVNGCVVELEDLGDDDTANTQEVLTWQKAGAEDATDYHQQCMDRFERTLTVAKAEDRNVVYDWCIQANLSVASTTQCGELELPNLPDLMTNEQEEESMGDSGSIF